jgi:Uma2 family endonuclease
MRIYQQLRTIRVVHWQRPGADLPGGGQARERARLRVEVRASAGALRRATTQQRACPKLASANHDGCRCILTFMGTARRLHYTYAEYLRALEVSGVKLEYCDGEIYAMAGGTPAHADLAAAAIRLLGNALLGTCRVSSSDLKVRVEATDLSTFPDVTVVCGDRRLSSIDPNAVTNPTLLVEVTSNSTEDYDRGEKLSHYKQIPSLAAVLLVSHRRQQVTIIERTPNGFQQREVRAGDTVELATPALRFAVDELYAGVALDTNG